MSGREDDVVLRQLVRTFEHDVKNPVGNILGYASLLREDGPPLTADQADVVHRIEQNCEMILAVLKQFVAAVKTTRD
jgi:signal transduction histidine kinase